MLEQLSDLHGAAAFGLIFALVAADALVPAVPGETATLAGAVLAAQGEFSLVVVVMATFLGAVVGDNVTFGLGRTGGQRLLRVRDGRPAARLAWAQRGLQTRGPSVILAARFVPAGRNAVSLAGGSLGMPWREYVLWDALAAALWALYASALGYLTGQTFEDSFVVPLVLSVALAAFIGAAAELALRRRRASR